MVFIGMGALVPWPAQFLAIWAVKPVARATRVVAPLSSKTRGPAFLAPWRPKVGEYFATAAVATRHVRHGWEALANPDETFKNRVVRYAI